MEEATVGTSRKIYKFEEVADAIPNLDFRDISHEEYRVYTFPTGSVKVDKPLAVDFTSSNSKPLFGGIAHRIIDVYGRSYYIPMGWLSLTWDNPEDEKRRYNF